MMKKRVRRVFDASFETEAVRRMEERKSKRVPTGESARNLGMPSGLLRRRARQLGEHAGQIRSMYFLAKGNKPASKTSRAPYVGSSRSRDRNATSRKQRRRTLPLTEAFRISAG